MLATVSVGCHEQICLYKCLMILLDDHMEQPLHVQKYNGSFFHRSAFSGYPNGAMDHAWAKYAQNGDGKY